MGSRCSCSNRAKARLSCSAMAGRNCPTRGGISCRRWPRPAFTWWPPICAAMAGPAHRRTSTPTRFFDLVGDVVGLVACARRETGGRGRPRLGRAGRLALRDVSPGYLHQGRRPERAAATARPRTAAGDVAPERHHQLLLAVFSAARRRGGRVRARRRHHHARGARRPTAVVRSGRRAVHPGGQGLSRRWPISAGRCRMAQRGRPRPLHRGLHKIRLPRRAELVSQPRSQLGTDGALARRANPSALIVHRGLKGFASSPA